MSSAERDHTPAEPSERSRASAGAARNAEREQAEKAPQKKHIGITARYAGSTAVGLVREHNEDNFLVSDLSDREAGPHNETHRQDISERGMIFAVCDGMGGAAAGEVASQSAVDALFEMMTSSGPPDDRDTFARRLVQSVQKAGREIFDTAQADRTRRGMGTTATVAGLMDSVLFLAQVGDSRAYLLRNGELELITKDQSLVNQLIEAGHLTEEEAESFEHSNIILQALGTSESVQVDLTFVELRKGDRVLLCSDGLSGMVPGEDIRETLQEVRDPAECCTKLIEQANAGGGHDNITVIVSDFDGDALAEPKADEHIGYMQYPLPEAAEEGVLDASAAKAEPGGTRVAANEDKPSRRNAQLVAMAAAVVVVGLAVAVSMSTSKQETSPLADEPAEPAEPTASATEPTEASSTEEATPEANEAEPRELVQVHVRTDVEDAELLVNGEPRGPLSPGEDRSLELPPGAYRFEARSDGSIAASSVVTLRADQPREVDLRLPSGSTEVAGSKRAQKQRQATPPARESRQAARAEAKTQRPAEEEPKPQTKTPGGTSSEEPAPEQKASEKKKPTSGTSSSSQQPAQKKPTQEEPKEAPEPGEQTKPDDKSAPEDDTSSENVLPENPF